MLEIRLHDGPARLGLYDKLETPEILKMNNIRFEDEPMPYDVPRPFAEFSVEETIKKANKSDENDIGIIHGSKYLDLRIKCALELENLDKQILMIANPEELLRRPIDLIKIIVNIRENINPNTALYFSFVKPYFIPLLTYIGIDFFGDFSCDFYARLDHIMTPDAIYNLKLYRLYEYNFDELKDYNHKTLDFAVKEVKANIRNGTLRNLVEERSCSSPETMTALKILDRDYTDYLDKYTQLY